MDDLHVGKGPYYSFFRPYHLTSLEVPLTCARIMLHGKPDMVPLPRPVAEVCAVAKRDLQPGEILVAPLTAPAWTPLFTRAAGVVTDVGSAAAHASIIAREYGIPAIVGCGDATARLRTGMRVTVDGTAGNVEPA